MILEDIASDQSFRYCEYTDAAGWTDLFRSKTGETLPEFCTRMRDTTGRWLNTFRYHGDSIKFTTKHRLIGRNLDVGVVVATACVSDEDNAQQVVGVIVQS